MTPAFKVVGADGKDLTQNYNERLIELTITDESTEQSDSLTIRLSDADGKLIIPERGHVLSVALGYDGKLRDMGKFTVDTVRLEGMPDTVTINGKAAPFTAADGYKPVQTRNTKSWDNVKLGDLVKEVAKNSGLVTSIGSDLSSIVIPHVDQTSESDINLITRLARQYGAVAKPTFGHLAFVKRGQSKSATGKDVGGVTIKKSDVSSYSAELGKRTHAGTVKTKYHDNVEASTNDIITKSATEEYKDVIHEDPNIYPDKEAAESAGKSQLDAMERGAQTVSLAMTGNVDIIAEGSLNLAEFNDSINGSWLVKSVSHSLTKSTGLRTNVKLENSAARASNQAKRFSDSQSSDEEADE